MLYACSKLCHITNVNKGRCPSCGDWLKEAGQDTEENREYLKKEAAAKHLSYKDSFRNKNIV